MRLEEIGKDYIIDNSRVQFRNSCWEWTGISRFFGAEKRPRGIICISRPKGMKIKQELAHRASYRAFRGEIPSGLFVIHSCDNPSCVNPAHLRLGTPAENSRDMVARGRQYKGESHHKAKLTESDVLEIRELLRSGATQLELAKRFSITRRSVNGIKNRKTWAWLQ